MNKLASLLSVTLLTSSAMTQACFDSNYGTSLGSVNDTVHPAQPIGFAFPLDGVTYSDIHISDHGVCWLSNGGTPAPAQPGATTYNVLLTDFTAFGPCLAPFWADANCGYAPNALGEVWINNTDPTRCVVTWTGIWTYFNIGPQYDFQMVLKNTGEVEFIYGPNVNNIGSSFAPNAIVGITTGQGAALPAMSDLSAGPTTVNPSIFEEFTAPLSFDVAADGLLFIPTNPGWLVVPLGGPAGCADVATFGDGCVRQDSMFFEDHASGTFDLSGVTMTMLRQGNSYFCFDAIPGVYLPPSATAAIVADGDELEQNVTLSSAMPVPGGSTTELVIESNGRVTLGLVGPGTDFSPNPADLQALGTVTLAPHWHDMNPAATGSGKITFEEINGIAYVTFDDVYSFGQTFGSTFQVQLNVVTGDITIVWVSSSLVGNNVLAGFTAGGATSLPSQKDLSTDLTTAFQSYDSERLPLTLGANNPVLGNNWTLTADNIDPVSPFALFFLGSAQGPGVPLPAIGLNAPGCSVWIDTVLVDLVGLASNGSATASLPIPNNPNLTGATLSAQAICLSLSNVANLLTSNGALGTLGI
jgi:hypothetical protein